MFVWRRSHSVLLPVVTWAKNIDHLPEDPDPILQLKCIQSYIEPTDYNSK